MHLWYYYLSSYLTLLTLHYGGCMERAWVAWEQAEEKGISYRESEQMVDSELFLDEYPRWGLGTPHQSVVLHEMFLHAAGQGQKEAECTFCRGHWGSVSKPEPEADLSAMELVGYQTSRKEMRDIYHSVYLLRRTPGTPSCGEWERRRVIHDILASLMVWLQRWTQPTTTGDVSPHAGEWVGLGQQGSYKVALQAACHRALETTEAF